VFAILKTPPLARPQSGFLREKNQKNNSDIGDIG